VRWLELGYWNVKRIVNKPPKAATKSAKSSSSLAVSQCIEVIRSRGYLIVVIRYTFGPIKKINI
jgi:hypothetical protein